VEGWQNGLKPRGGRYAVAKATDGRRRPGNRQRLRNQEPRHSRKQNNPPDISGLEDVEEGGGFEPPVVFSYSRFPGVCLKPLSHPSASARGDWRITPDAGNGFLQRFQAHQPGPSTSGLMQSGYVGTRIGARPTGTEAHIGDCISTAPLAAPFPSPPRFGGFACGTFRSAKDQRPATTCSSPPSARLSIRHRRFEPGAGNRLALGAEAWTPQQEVKCVGWGNEAHHHPRVSPALDGDDLRRLGQARSHAGQPLQNTPCPRTPRAGNDPRAWLGNVRIGRFQELPAALIRTRRFERTQDLLPTDDPHASMDPSDPDRSAVGP